MTGRHDELLTERIAAVDADDQTHLDTFTGGLHRDLHAVIDGLILCHPSVC